MSLGLNAACPTEWLVSGSLSTGFLLRVRVRGETSKHLRPFPAPFPAPFLAPFYAQVVGSKYSLQIKHDPPPYKHLLPGEEGTSWVGVQGKMKTQGSLFKIVKNSRMVTAEPEAKWGALVSVGAGVELPWLFPL